MKLYVDRYSFILLLRVAMMLGIELLCRLLGIDFETSIEMLETSCETRNGDACVPAVKYF